MKRRRCLSLLTMLVMLALVAGACTNPTPAPSPAAAEDDSPAADATGPIKIGAIFDLTGPTADIGVDGAAGVRDFVDYLNSQGGIDGRSVELLSDDYGYRIDSATALYTQFVEEGAVVFLGWGTGDTEALRTRVARDEVPFISASYSAKLADPSVTPYNFLAGPTYSDQLTILLKYMLDQWQADGNTDLPKVAIFHDDSPFGASPLPAAEAFQAVTGVEFMAIPMPRGVDDFTPQLTTAQEFGATHIAIQNVPSPAAQLLQDKAALEMGDVPVFCLNYCANEQLVRLADAAAEDVIGAIPFTPLSTDVPGMADIREYAAAHDIDLASKSATYVQGWWFAKIMAEAIRRTLDAGDALTGANIKTALESMDNWETGGMTAPITFTADDHRGQRAVRLYQVQDGVWEQLTDYISAE